MAPTSNGSYALVLRLPEAQRLTVGRLGTFVFDAGLYVYVGSAFGPGGLRARIAHHMRRATRPHWHIDYLRRVCTVEDVWYVEGKRLECVWAERLDRSDDVVALTGFGCSDCRCRSHLFRIDELGIEDERSSIVGNEAVNPAC